MESPLPSQGGVLPAIFEACYPFLRLMARQYVHCAADAEDVVQDGVVRFWKYGRNHATDPRAYLATCVRNAALDFLKAGRIRREQEQEARADGTAQRARPLFECPLEQEEARKVLEQALHALPVEQREVLVLKVWGELTFPQIGALLEVSHNTAASRYRYALAALRERLAESFVQ